MTDTTVVSVSSSTPSMVLPGAPHSAGRALPGPATKAGPPRRFPFWVAGVAGVLAVAACVVYIPHLYVEETDDAYVQADTVAVMPKVAGYVTALHVTDNSRFTAHQLLVEIDPRDFQVAVTARKPTCRALRRRKPTCSSNFTNKHN